jgi:hypothetical protein
MRPIGHVSRTLLIRSPRKIGCMILTLLGRICTRLIDSFVSMGILDFKFGLRDGQYKTGQERVTMAFISCLEIIRSLALYG